MDKEPKGCCRVEAVVAVDERGQMVLPKEVRNKARIKAGDKLAVVMFENGDQICCIALIKTESFDGMVKTMLAPIAGNIAEK